MTASWPLLSDLDALLSREGWQDDASFHSAVAEMERRIADECGILGRHHFLRSRDAAARLEEAVIEHDQDRLYFEHSTHTVDGVRRHVIRYDLCGIMVCAAGEAAARTRAALEAGWRVGLWPVRREG